jgi:hypothetical protein
MSIEADDKKKTGTKTLTIIGWEPYFSLNLYAYIEFPTISDADEVGRPKGNRSLDEKKLFSYERVC